MGRKYLIALIIILSLSGSLLALTGAEGVGNPILDLGLGARPLAMGGAFCSIAHDPSSGYWNPAGLATFQNIYITSMYTSLFLGTKFYYLGMVYPINTRLEKQAGKDGQKAEYSLVQTDEWGSISVIWVESFVSGLKNIKDATDPTTGLPFTQYDNFTARDDAVLISYGAKVLNWLRLGGSFKLVFRNLGINNAKGQGWGGDAGFQVLALNGLTLAGVFQDVEGSKISWDYLDENNINRHSSEKIQSRLKGGISYDFARFFKHSAEIENVRAENFELKTNTTNQNNDTFTNNEPQKVSELVDSFVLSSEVRWLTTSDAKPTYHFGMEWAFYDAVFLRMGLDDVNFTGGVGLKAKMISMDYAYVTHPDLNNTHRISLTVWF